MDDLPASGINASPSINSVLKPPKQRYPLKELVLAANEEDNTAARKRRVSFANVNKIKEFSAGAESMVVCHTPAYEEPFSMSSDSSCPSGADGWTPDKNGLHSDMLSNCSSARKECGYGQPLFTSRTIGYGLTENILLASPSSNPSANVMDLTNCNNRILLRDSTRFSIGMDLTEVIKSSVNDSEESMDLTKGGVSQSCQQFLYQTDMNVSDGMLADDSDALEFTDAVIDPRFSLASTTHYASNFNTTKNLYSVNNTRYSLNGMDLTKAAMSPCSSVARRSSRYSLSNMDLTEAVGNNCSGLEFTEVISEPKIITTRYSINDMDLTEAITRDDLTRFTLNSMDMTGEKLECSLTSDSSMDLTKPIFKTNKSINSQAIVLDAMDLTEHAVNVENRPPTCYSGNMDSIEFNDSNSDTEDTPTTQTYNGTQPLLENKTVTTGKDITLQEECNVEKSKAEIKVDEGTFVVHNIKNNNLFCNVIQDEFSNQKCLADSSIGHLKDSVGSIHKDTQVDDLDCNEMLKENEIFTNLKITSSKDADEGILPQNESDNSKKDDSSEITKTNCKNNENLSNEESEIYFTKGNQENSTGIGNRVSLKTNEMLEEEHITLINDESMDLSEPLTLSYLPISRKSLNPVIIHKMKSNESGNEILEMDISSPAKNITDKCPLPNGQNTVSNDGDVVCTLFPTKNKSQLVFNIADRMEGSFSESNSAKKVEDCNTKEHSCITSVNAIDIPIKATEEYQSPSTLEINKQMTITEKVQNEDKSEHLEIETINLNKTGHNESCGERIEESTQQRNCSRISLSNSVDFILNVSANTTLFGKNITMTRGGISPNRTATDDSVFESSKDDSIRVAHEHPSEMESSMPLIQRLEKFQKTLDTPRGCSSESWNQDILPRKERGEKRSFEIALEPENDTEESPVKQICLSSAIQLPDSECLNNMSAPSFLMNKLTVLHDLVPCLHQSETNISINIGAHSTQSATVDVNIERNSFSQNEHVDIKTTSVLEQSVSKEDHGNNVSLKINLSTNCDVSSTQCHVEKENYVQRQQNDDDETPVVCSQLREISLQPTPHQVCSPDSQSDRQTLHRSSLRYQIPQLLSHSGFQHNLLSKNNERSHNDEFKLNQFPNAPAVMLKTTNIFSKERSVMKLREGVFTYNLIPRWVEAQFSVMPNGNIINTSYKLICTEYETAIGEYLLKRLLALPEEQRNLATVTEEPCDTFFLHLAKNLSFICKYYSGTLKGNILSLEVVSCKQKFWTFVDVNIKYPKYLSAEDVTISEQRIGELKLSIVRQIFDSVEKGDDQLLNFAAALNNLKY